MPSTPVAILSNVLDGDSDATSSRQGSRSAEATFDALYERRFADTCRFVRALGGRAADVEDLAQETFLVARRKLSGFDGKNEAGWLFAIARHVVRSERRKRWLLSFFSPHKAAPLDDLVSRDADPEARLARAEDLRLAERALERLTEKRRVPFVLFELEGYSGEEIASLLDIPVATVWTRLHHARRDFAAFVAEEGPR